MCKHCIKCHGFAWWDGDYCCTMKMALIEESPDGKFWAVFPEAFNANNCEYYDEDENYNVSDYYNQYIDFLVEHYELNYDPNHIEDKELILKELGYKNYKQ